MSESRIERYLGWLKHYEEQWPVHDDEFEMPFGTAFRIAESTLKTMLMVAIDGSKSFLLGALCRPFFELSTTMRWAQKRNDWHCLISAWKHEECKQGLQIDAWAHCATGGDAKTMQQAKNGTKNNLPRFERLVREAYEANDYSRTQYDVIYRTLSQAVHGHIHAIKHDKGNRAIVLVAVFIATHSLLLVAAERFEKRDKRERVLEQIHKEASELVPNER